MRQAVNAVRDSLRALGITMGTHAAPAMVGKPAASATTKAAAKAA
jgi:hypothetical protein